MSGRFHQLNVESQMDITGPSQIYLEESHFDNPEIEENGTNHHHHTENTYNHQKLEINTDLQ